MREILFRGFSKEMKRWIYGHYLTYETIKDAHFIAPIWQDEKDRSMYGNLTIEVQPESVGQFTGFILENGQKVFEGDIISFINKPTHHSEVKLKYIVKFGKVYLWSQQSYAGTYAFYTVQPNSTTEYGLTHLLNEGMNVEVIGNVHEHTHLLNQG